MDSTTLLLALCFFAAATLYSSVGHAGASAYLALMALFGIPEPTMRPTAFALNILVASITLFRFYRAGAFSWATFWPFAVGAVPIAYAGGKIELPAHTYNPIVGVVLIVAALRLVTSFKSVADKPLRKPPLVAAVPVGAAIGLLSGLTGTGGGIFLSPVLILMHWSDARKTAGVSAAFILVNSIAGLSGKLTESAALPHSIWLWLIAVAAGGLLGSTLGSRRFDLLTLRRLLAVVLFAAGVKLLLVRPTAKQLGAPTTVPAKTSALVKFGP